MNEPRPTEEDPEDEVALLVLRLHETQQRLKELAGGAVDAVLHPGGQSYLLHEAQEKLRLSEERFRQISGQLAKVLDSSLDVICAFDAEGCFVQVSAACEKIWGYRPDELLGTPYLDKVVSEDRALTMEAAAQIMAGKPTTCFENRYENKSGVVKYIMWSAWWSEADRLMYCVARDSTEAREAEAAARDLSERLRLATKASKVGIWDWDVLTGVMHWDEQMFELYGIAPADSLGVELWQRHLHPDDYERANAEIAEALREGGAPFDTRFRIVLPTCDEIRHIRAQGQVYRDAAGRARRLLGTNWDITEQMKHEEILRLQLEKESLLLSQARAGEKAKSEFLAVMSHEIRTPMNSVLGFAEMLALSPSLNPEDRELSEIIVSSGEVLLRILDDILNFSSIESGLVAIEAQPFSPGELVQDIQILYERQIRQKGLQFILSMAEDLPRAVRGDAGRIRQILVNLLGNALKFTASGLIQLDCRVETGSMGRVLQFSVRDTGDGIPPEKSEAVFEAFTQADSSVSRLHGGTGLGLTISRRLAGLMSGVLTMSRHHEKGMVFTLQMPLATVSLPQPAGAAPVAPEEIADFARRHPLSILVVEDDKVNLKLIVNVLQKLGYRPLSAPDGEEAVSVYLTKRPECILMDIQMPHLDGIEAARQIRALEAASGLRPAFISALTANTSPDHQQRCREAGMNAYANKPVKRQKIIELLTEATRFQGSALAPSLQN